MCKAEGKYKKVYLTHERASVTVLRAATRISFAVLHSTEMPRERAEALVDEAYKRYINAALYDPLYSVEEKVDPSVFGDILNEY